MRDLEDAIARKLEGLLARAFRMHPDDAALSGVTNGSWLARHGQLAFGTGNGKETASPSKRFSPTFAIVK